MSASEAPAAATPPQASETYTASCHCNRFQYTVTVSPPLTDSASTVVDCNCSICSRNGYLLIYIDEKNITYQKGSDDEFSTYLFATKKVAHYFCPTCGTSCFAKSQDPTFFAGMKIVNVRTFHDLDLKALTLKPMDGKSYNAGV
ncbi:hypothetical protein K505DRAFT_421390 [Melanomma pulvis-pyrius CBS 109.77]|uniref:CENP-V/GFA domain-containing protein n=1 Tax=Melanomma pulvis-pyrius CBS 109.77 TaxID=1314802 RepID=A0A6A6WVS1_9PLEO|nr:hypothetical protein K505DRAFT_421390 [Melanomma pulvis-pyrius CBS 109.77]